jgi:DNA polymerase elongation subunit (family B)
LAVCDLINGDEASNWQRHFFYWSPKTAGAAELGGGNESDIANTMRAQEAAAIERGDFVKHTAEEVPIVIHACASERAMLAVFANQIRKLRLDWFISYNGESFDIPYMATRIRKCFSEGDRKLAWSYGRDEGETRPPKRAGAPPTPEEIKKATAAKLAGRIVLEPTAFDTIGLASFDALKFAQSLNLESAKLSEVSSHLFGADDSKVDLSYEEMMQAAYEDTAEGWGAIMVYNLRDSLMPIRILSAKKQFGFSLQLSRVSGCALPAITAGGQSKRLLAMVQREAKVRDMVINEPTKLDFPDAPWLHGGGTKVKGALVLDIEPGFYSDPIMVNDYAGLYPSIILSCNLSFETLIASHNCTQPDLGDDVPPALKEVTRMFHVEERDEATDAVSLTWHYPIILKGHNGEREGLYPCIVRKILQERKDAKREMKKHESGSAMHTILDARQNALKVLANSSYGILNAVLKGRLYCRPLGAIVTSEGRNAIRTIVNVVEKIPNSLVVAGDTDSCMFLLRGRSVFEAFAEAEKVAAEVNSILHARGATTKTVGLLNMQLEVEKCMYRSVFVAKKAYSYMKLEDPDGKPKHVSMGLLSKKRGTAQLLKDAFIACEQAYLIPHEFDERDVRLLQLRILRELMRALADEVEETQFIRTSFLHHQYRPEFNGAHVVATRRWCEETGAPWPGGSRIKTLLAKPSQLVKATDYKAYMYTYTYDHFTQQGLQLDLSRYVSNVAGRFEALLRFTIPDVAQRFKKAVDLLAHTGSQKRLTFQGAPSPVPPRITKPINKMTEQELRNAIDEIDPCIGDVVGAHLFTNTNEAPRRVIAPPPSHTPPVSSFKMAGPWALLMAKPVMNEEEERRKRQKKVDSGVREAAGGTGFRFDALQ